MIFNQHHRPDAAGRPNDLLVLVGIHFFLTGLIGMVMRPSMEALMEGIRLGTFDFLLTKPADPSCWPAPR